ncbi:MAG TPA: GNAT family N-acetyltransferase [Patescibacteria group bacterium]|nr:GNAT family N-acetyltransferase [Patescibacteria group bacterium]
MQNPVLRPISLADAEQLRKLYKYSLEKNARGFVTDPDYHGDIVERAIQYQLSNGAMLGLFAEDGVLLGFGGLKQKENGRVELCNLHLHPHQHGKGLGKQLALALIDEARELEYETIELHVTATQEAAIGLYRRLGFIETHRKVYEVEGKSFDTVFMELAL